MNNQVKLTLNDETELTLSRKDIESELLCPDKYSDNTDCLTCNKRLINRMFFDELVEHYSYKILKNVKDYKILENDDTPIKDLLFNDLRKLLCKLQEFSDDAEIKKFIKGVLR